MHTLVASSNDYASAASGYVISVLVAILIALVGFMGKIFSKKIDRIEVDYNTLDKTVAVLSETVHTLKTAVDKLPNLRR